MELIVADTKNASAVIHPDDAQALGHHEDTLLWCININCMPLSFIVDAGSTKGRIGLNPQTRKLVATALNESVYVLGSN
jgi:hypothetical protein